MPQARREWHGIVKVMKGKNLQPRLLYPSRTSFRFDRERQISHDITYMWNLKKMIEMKLFIKQTHRKQTYGYQTGKGGVGIN